MGRNGSAKERNEKGKLEGNTHSFPSKDDGSGLSDMLGGLTSRVEKIG